MNPDEPARLGNEVFRDRHLVVRVGWFGGLEVTITMREIGEMTVVLDEFKARDLVNQLESWRAGWFPPIGPAER